MNDLCTSVDNQNILVIPKSQVSSLNHSNELDKYTMLTIDDFIAPSIQDCQLQFDELGVLKQCKPRTVPSRNNSSVGSPTNGSINHKIDLEKSANATDKQGS